MLVLVALMGIEIWELARDPSIFLAEGFLDSFLSSITSLVVAVEFVKMLLRPTVGNTLELLIMALSRYVVLNHHEPVSLATRRFLSGRPEGGKDDRISSGPDE